MTKQTYRPRNATAQTVLAFIKAYRKEHGGISPSHREIRTACNLSASSVVTALDALEAWGIIHREPNIARGIQVLKEDDKQKR